MATFQIKAVNEAASGRGVDLKIERKMAVFWVVAPCSLVKVYQRFRGPCCLHHQGDRPGCKKDNPEDSHLRTHRRDNLKSYFENGNFTQNNLHTVTGNIQRILVEQLQIHFSSVWQGSGLFRNESVFHTF
jgi:hypothetical protein